MGSVKKNIPYFVLLQAVWLTQPQSEPSLYLEKWIPAKDLVACGDIWTYANFCILGRGQGKEIYNQHGVSGKSRWRRPTTEQWNHPTSPSWPALWGWSTRMTFLSQRPRSEFFYADYEIQLSFSPLFVRRTSTTPGRRTLLLSTSSSARRLSWVRNISESLLINIIITFL